MAQMLGAPGRLREAVGKVRSYWRVADPPAELPPESETLLLPPGVVETASAADLRAVINGHPLAGLPASSEGSRPLGSASLRAVIIDRWQADLRYVLRAGDLPDEHLRQRRGPYDVHPLGGSPIPRGQLPWYRFAGTIVLYVVPLGEASVFARYGGLPATRGDGAGSESATVPTLDFWSERELRRREIRAAQPLWLDQMVLEKLWEFRAELGGLDLEQAKREVLFRFGGVFRERLEARAEQLEGEPRHGFEESPGTDAGEHEPTPDERRRLRSYHVAFDPTEDTDDDVKRTVRAIRADAGFGEKGGGNTERGDLQSVEFALLLEEPGMTAGLLALSAGLSEKRVKEIAKEGREILERGRGTPPN